MAFVFDGPNKLITLTSGTTEIAVQDMYSRWKDWVADGNAQYDPAMRAVGGDPISDISSLGSTYFMVNGWRIRPASENHNLKIVGNIYTDPSGFSPVSPPPGSFSIVVELTVSTLVESTLAQITEIEHNSFNGGVTVDLTSPFSGVAYPIGTTRQPVNNLADGLLIATSRGFDTFYIMGDAVIDTGGDYTNKVFKGQSPLRSNLAISAAAIVTDAEFYDANISGTLDGQVFIKDCHIGTVTYISGHIEKCLIHGPITLGGNGTAHFLNCWGGNASSPNIIDCGGVGQTLILRQFSGPVTIRNKTGPEDAEINLVSGSVTLESTVTGGNIYVQGLGKLIDNSTGTAVTESDYLVSPHNIWNFVTESGVPVITYMKRLFAAIFGRTAGVGTLTEQFKSMDGTKNRVTMTYDANGNRVTPNFDDS